MSYWLFLLVFVCLPLAGVIRLLAVRRSFRRDLVWALVVILIIAVIYAMPWQNYLAATGVWYFNPGLTLPAFGYVPPEHYLFFALQIVLTGLFALLLWRLFYPGEFELTAKPKKKR